MLTCASMTGVGGAAARRHRPGPGPLGHDAGRDDEHPRRDRLPKNQLARDLMTGAPAEVDRKQFKELGLDVRPAPG
jgi:hypothetical protein